MNAIKRFSQYAFFPLVVIGTPSAIYVLAQNGVSVPIATYLVIVVLGLLFWLAEWLMPYRTEWNQPQGDLSNDVISGTVAYTGVDVDVGAAFRLPFLVPTRVALCLPRGADDA